MDAFKKNILERIAPFTDVPIIFTSTISKQRLHKALEKALEVYQNRAQKIPTSKLNEFLLPDIESNPPPSHKGKYIRIKYITQIPTHVPTIAFFCNLPQYLKDPYKRFIENQLRGFLLLIKRRDLLIRKNQKMRGRWTSNQSIIRRSLQTPSCSGTLNIPIFAPSNAR